jgi:fructose/tagatose bisphosphate aldolase
MIITKDLFARAYGKYALGAYNINNLEQVMSHFQGCSERRSRRRRLVENTTLQQYQAHKHLEQAQYSKLKSQTSKNNNYRTSKWYKK